MPVEIGIWRMGESLEQLSSSRLDSEAQLEDFLEKEPNLLDAGLMIIGRQVPTDFGHRVDLLGVDAEGRLLVIELKRDKTPRDVVAQTLDYGCWVQNLTYTNIAEIYEDYARERDAVVLKHFEQAFSERFGAAPPENLNESHQLVIVASEIDASTERIVGYLTENYGVPINVVFFRHFRDGTSDYLTRAWLRDPVEAAEAVSRPGRGELWNGHDFYVALGEGVVRTWADCVKYGFVSGGQGRWYSQTLKMLFPGARVFVHIPTTGYVGVGTVVSEAQMVRDFTVKVDGQDVPILEVKDKATPQMDRNSDNPELSEYVVGVEWIKARAKENAIWEPGMFANQNTVCRLRNKFTLDRLVDRFGLDE